MEYKYIQYEWDTTPDKGILPEGAKARMWAKIFKLTQQKRMRFKKWAVAGVAVVLSIVSYELFIAGPHAGTELVEVHTYPKDIRLLRLPDGTRIWVNQNTEINYPETFTGDVRSITLKGEAYFEVARNPLKPFIITSGDITTTVLGTSFAITAYEGQESVVKVTSGKVKVQGQQNKVFLEKNNVAVYQRTSGQLQKNKTHVAEPEWKKVLIDIDGLTLQEVIDKLKKQDEFTVVYHEPGLENLKIKGILDTRQGLAEMLQTVAFALRLKITDMGNNTYLISK